MLFGCSRAGHIWSLCGLHKTIRAARLPGKSGAEILEFLLCDIANQKVHLDVIEMPKMVAVTCWHIWWQRREIEKGEDVQNIERASKAILAIALNFVRAAVKKVLTPRINKWTRPLLSQLVLNTDASFLEDEHTGSCGAIIRDHSGFFIVASTTKLEHVGDVETAEVATLLEE